MQKTLIKLEVSQKQKFIFSQLKLKENSARSDLIRAATSPEFFRYAAGEAFREENVVFCGGGQAVLQFDSREEAVEFARRVSERAMREFDGMELFVKCVPYDEALMPKDNLRVLSDALEKKKALRAAALGTLRVGVEGSPLSGGIHSEFDADCFELKAPEGYSFAETFEEIAPEEDAFLSVIHADGNAMGKRIEALYDSFDASQWNEFCAAADEYSRSVQSDFEDAFRAMAKRVAESCEGIVEINNGVIPIRPVVLAGDDVCFVAPGKIGTECARILLEELSARTNKYGGAYAACAGVALVHKKYPFHLAYQTAELLCDRAKAFGAKLDEKRRISLMDWSIQFGQMKTTLSQIEADYITEDGNLLNLHPVTVIVPDEVKINEEKIKVNPFRTYDYFRALCQALVSKKEKLARGKLKELRTAMKQGTAETAFALHDQQIRGVLSAVWAAWDEKNSDFNKLSERLKQISEQGKEKKDYENSCFIEDVYFEAGTPATSQLRCVLFDGVEMMDHCEFLKEGSK